MEENKRISNEEIIKPNQTINIVGFIFAFIFPLVGLILSIIGLTKSKKTGVGKGLSIAGVIISIIGVIISILAIIIIISAVTTMNNTKCKLAKDCVLNADGSYNCKYTNSNYEETTITCDKDYSNNSEDNTIITNNSNIYFYKFYFSEISTNYIIESSTTKPISSEIISTYVCKTNNCYAIYSEHGTSTYSEDGLIIYDGNYYLYNYKTIRQVDIPSKNYTEIIFINNKQNPSLLYLYDNDSRNYALYDIDNSKMLIDFKDRFSIIQNSNDKYLIIKYDEKAEIMELSSRKILFTAKYYESMDEIFSGEALYQWGFLENNYQTYIVGYFDGQCTGCGKSVHIVYTLGGKKIYENDKYTNYALLNDKELLIVNNSQFYVYESEKLKHTSKKYKDILPINSDFYDISPSSRFDGLVINDDKNISIIDSSENIISKIDTSNSNISLRDINNSKIKDNIITIYVVDESLSLNDFTDEDFKNIGITRTEIIDQSKYFIVSYGYKYNYNILTKNIVKTKEIFEDV